MPLLKRKPFTPENPPTDLKPSDEVFVCVHTNEVFTDYESFFKRTILCNSLVWSCKFTGKSNLTYSEALKSERQVIKQGNSLSSPLQRATLTLVHNIQRGRLANLCDEVFSYLKDRYQEGEDVEVQHSGKRRKGKVQKVFEPEELPNGIENKVTSPNSRKSSSSSGKDKKTEKSTSTPGKIRKGSDGGGKSRKSSESTLASPGKSKSTPELLEIPDTPERGSSGSVSPKSHKKVLTPKQKHISKTDGQVLSSPTSKSSKEVDDSDDVIIIEDSETKQKEESPLKSPKNKNTEFWPDPKTYKYAVQLYHDKNSKKKDAKEVVIVDFDHLCRKKGSFTRDKLKNFLKLSCERSSQNSEGFYYVIAEYRAKFDLEDPPFEIQLDSPPKKSKKRKSSQHDGGETSSAKKKRAKTDGKLSKDDLKSKKKSKKLTHEEKLQLIEEERDKRRKAIEEDKEKRKIQKEKEKIVNQKRREEEKERRKVEKEQLREQKRQEAILLKEWSRPREDLELDDLKDLPEPLPIQVKIANELFGDAVMVVEFLYVFGSLFDMKDEFPSSLSFSMLEEALAETDPEGVYYDLLQFLLGAILRTHMDEEEEEGLESADSHNPLDLDDEDYHTAKVSASAAMAAVWPMLHQGKPLHELIMDPYTCTELLRLHLLSSGARIGCGDAEYRWQSRGGFTYADDAGVEFRHREPDIMKYLMTGSVYELSADEKLKILTALCGQLMTYATSREYVEDGFDKLKKARREWLSDQWAEQRREKEEAAARYRKRQEERLKQKEEIERKKKEKENEKNQEDGKDGSNTNKDSSVQEESKQEATKESKKGKNKKKGNKETVKDSEDKGKDVNKSNENPVEEDKKKQDEPAVLTKEEEEQIALQKKLDRERREQEYLEETRKAVAMCSIQPLGRDRIYRRYWSFRSVKGLYVEEDDPDLPLFLDTIFEEEENCEDDREKDNDGDEGQNKEDDSKQREIDEKKLKETRIKQLKRAEIIDKYGARNGKMRWSFIAEQQDFDGLINALNPRGYRERTLRDALQSDYRYLTKTIEKCPFREDFVPQKKIPKSKPRKQQTIDRSRYKTTEEFLEANLRDQILDLEDRLWQGGLGSTKVEDRIAWRVKVENGIYSHLKDNMEEIKTENTDNQTDVEMKDEKDESLLNGNLESPQPVKIEQELKPDQVDVKSEKNGEDVKIVTNGESKDEETDPELTKVEDQKEFQFSSIPTHLKLDLNDSRLSGSPDQSRTGTPVISLAPTSMPVNPAVKELALSLLKVEQGIESKYLSLPLGEDEETKRQKQKDAAALALAEFNEMMNSTDESKDAKKKKPKKTDKEDVDCKTKDDKDEGEKKEDDDDNSSNSSTQDIPSKQKTCLERWEESLMACSSLAQVFVHLNTLDGSITWSKSILNARCRLCRRKGDGEKMLLCDACDRGHHMYCLKPPIKEIPEGNWFCPDCRPKETRRSERRRRAPVKDDEEEEEEEEEDESEEDEESEEESEFDENSDEASDAGSEHVDLCALCEEDGELLCCDVCPLAYHMECAYPPLRRVPRGSWACQVCTGADDERPKKRRVKKSTIKAALNSAKEKEKQKTSKKSKTTKSKSQKRSRGQKDSSSSKRQRTRESSPTSSVSSTPASSRRRRHLPTSLRINGRSSVDSSRSPSPVRKSSKRDPRLTGRMIKCGKLIDEVMQHVDADFFSDPISLAKYPNYNDSPLDLGTIKTNIQENAYSTVDDFVSDVRKVFIDCAEHFRPRAKEARAGVRLSAFFETRLSEMSLDVSQRAVRSTRRT